MSKIIIVKLTPKSSSNRVGKWEKTERGEEVLRLYVTAPPEDNKANKAMLKLLSVYLKVPVTSLGIIRGHTTRLKWIQYD